MTGDMQFRLEAQGRSVGRFRAVERVPDGVALAGWLAELRASEPVRASIVLTDRQGAELRRWDCQRIEWCADRVVVRRLRRVS